MTTYFLCNDHELTENKPRSFTVSTSQGELALLILKLQKHVYAYKNNCPHLGIPLNWQPDDFLSLEQTHIQCSTHGALFTMEEGYCIAGPCSGQNLERLTVKQHENEIWLQL